MALDAQAVRAKLARLGDRDWPEEFGPEQSDEDYLGWCHRYQLEEPASEAEVERFERIHRVTLPAEYRHFLTQLGNGGVGPGYGIFPLGEGEEEPLPDTMLDNLSRPFAHTGAWNDSGLPQEEYYSYSVVAGALEIATDGCALFYLLVVSGPAKGQVWYDKRTDSEGIEPLRGEDGAILTFGQWYANWLASIPEPD